MWVLYTQRDTYIFITFSCPAHILNINESIDWLESICFSIFLASMPELVGVCRIFFFFLSINAVSTFSFHFKCFGLDYLLLHAFEVFLMRSI